MKKAIIIIMALLMTATLIPATALADGETISVTGGTSAAAEYGDTFVYIAPQITVSSPDNINAASVAISDLPGDCTIGYTNKPASVAVTVRSDNKVVTVTGNASAADYQQALRGIYINVGTTTANVTFDIGISVDNALFYGSNKHYYEFVPAMGIGWEAAAAAASAKTLYGMQGYLATITSAEENEFVYSFCGGRAWLGGSDAAIENEWRWVTGPEAGTKFWQATGPGVGSAEPGMYTNWQMGEPNEYPPDGEDYLHIFGYDISTDPAILGQWNDFNKASTSTHGYVIEWGGMSGDSDVDTSETCFLSIVSSITYHTVSFNSHGGSAVDPISNVPSGSKVVEPGEPTRAGYDFDGWFTTDSYSTQWVFYSDTVNSDITLHAKWTARTDTPYAVEHYQQDTAGEGYTLAGTDNLTGTTGSTATAAAKTYAGFTENTTHALRAESGTITGDGLLVLKLYYDRETYSVLFNKNTTDTVTGMPTSQTVRYGGKAAEPAEPSRTDYEFIGWYKEEGCSNAWVFASDTVTAETTLYAKWSQDVFTITYDSNDGSGAASDKQNDGATFELHNGSGFTRADYVIVGWNIGGSEYELGALYTMPSSDVTANAVWEKDSDNDGTSDKDEEAVGTNPNDSGDKPLTGKVTITVYGQDGNAAAGLTCVLNSEPRTAVTGADGRAVFNHVSLSAHTLSLRSGSNELGTYSLDFENGSANSAELTAGGVSATVSSTFISLDLMIHQSGGGDWALDDADYSEQITNPETGHGSKDLLWICMAVVLSALIAVFIIRRYVLFR